MQGPTYEDLIVKNILIIIIIITIVIIINPLQTHKNTGPLTFQLLQRNVRRIQCLLSWHTFPFKIGVRRFAGLW